MRSANQPGVPVTGAGASPTTTARPGVPVLPDPRVVELLVCSTALVGCWLRGRLPVPLIVLAAVVGLHGLVLTRWPARRGLRLACLALMLVLLGVLPATRYVQATDRGNVHLAIDGSVLVSDEAVRVLLDGDDPYRASYKEVLAGSLIDVQGRPAANPLAGHYPYWPGSLGPLLAVEVPLRSLGLDPEPRVLYLLVYCLLGLWLGWWSLRERGHLGVAVAVCLNPLLLPYLWQGANDVLLVAGVAVAAVALTRRRVVLAGLALGAAVSVKHLLVPMVLLFLVWLAAEARHGRLGRGQAWRAAAAGVAPAVLAAAPFLAWHPVDLLTDTVGYHLALVTDAYPIAGEGLPGLLLRAGVVDDPFGPTPLWATALPAAAVVLLGAWRVWSRPGLRTLLGVSGLVMLGVLFFHRSFMLYYVAVPVTALLLAALVGGQASRTRFSTATRSRQ
jgi:hypothetical protein